MCTEVGEEITSVDPNIFKVGSSNQSDKTSEVLLTSIAEMEASVLQKIVYQKLDHSLEGIAVCFLEQIASTSLQTFEEDLFLEVVGKVALVPDVMVVVVLVVVSFPFEPDS